MNRVFAELIGRTMEIYVDKMVPKTIERGSLHKIDRGLN